MAGAAQIAAKRAARKAAGCCTECDNAPETGHSLCSRHLQLQVTRLARYNGKRNRHNLCYCGEQRAPRRSRCAV